MRTRPGANFLRRPVVCQWGPGSSEAAGGEGEWIHGRGRRTARVVCLAKDVVEVFLVASEGGRKAEGGETRARLRQGAGGEIEEEHGEGVLHNRRKMGWRTPGSARKWARLKGTPKPPHPFTSSLVTDRGAAPSPSPDALCRPPFLPAPPPLIRPSTWPTSPVVKPQAPSS